MFKENLKKHIKAGAIKGYSNYEKFRMFAGAAEVVYLNPSNKRLEEIKQVFRNTWADREASLLLAQLAEGDEVGIARPERYALVFNADDETLEKWRAISMQKLREQNYDLSAVVEPFDRQSSYLVVGWFSSEAYAQAFYKRNASALNASRVAVVSQEDYLAAQWTKNPLF